MTELLAALLGAIVGGGLSAWVGSRQTAKVLKHETDLAAAERREAARADASRRRTIAADQLIAALAEFTTVNRDDRGQSASFVRVPAPKEIHQERTHRVSALLKAGSSHSHALPTELRERWDAMTWMVRFNHSNQPDRSEEIRRRDASDLLNFIEYVRRSLLAVSTGTLTPPHYPAPDARRKGTRSWGVKPEGRPDEPDLTEWHRASLLVGQFRYTTGEVGWQGPNGLVEDHEDKPAESRPSGE